MDDLIFIPLLSKVTFVTCSSVKISSSNKKMERDFDVKSFTHSNTLQRRPIMIYSLLQEPLRNLFMGYYNCHYFGFCHLTVARKGNNFAWSLCFSHYTYCPGVNTLQITSPLQCLKRNDWNDFPAKSGHWATFFNNELVLKHSTKGCSAVIWATAAGQEIRNEWGCVSLIFSLNQNL